MPGNGDGPSSDDQRYFVKRTSGKVFGPFDKSALRMMLKAGKIGPEAAVSIDKDNWNPIADLPAFADLVGDESGDKNETRMGGFAAAPSGDADGSAELPTSAEDDGGGDVPLPQSKEAADGGGDEPELPTPKGSGSSDDGGAELPTPKGSGSSDDGGPDLPTPKDGGSSDDGPGLPAPKGSSSSDDGPELPTPKDDADPSKEVPTEKASSGDLLQAAHSAMSSDDDHPGLGTDTSARDDGEDEGADLPASAEDGGDLPRSAEGGGGGDLPRSAEGGGDLPRSAEADLPESAQGGGEELPRSAQDNLPRDAQDNLPRDAQDNLPRDAQDNLPRDAQQDDLPASAGGDSLPQDAREELPRSTDDSDFESQPLEAGGPPDESDLFAGSDEDQQDDDLFADDQQDDDDLFAEEQEDDDLFAEEQEDDDLFAEEQEDDDLFTDEEEALFSEDEDDDDLFAEESPDAQAGGPGGQSPSADANFGGDEEIDLDGGGPPDMPPGAGGGDAGGQAGPGSGPGGGPDDAFGGEALELDDSAAGGGAPGAGTAGQPARPQSSGIPDEDQESQESDQQAPEAAPDDGSPTKIVGIAVALVVLIAGGGVGAYMYLGGGEKKKKKKTTEKTTPQDLSITGLDQDTYTKFRSVIGNKKPSDLSQRGKAKLLLTQSLFLSRYTDDTVAETASTLSDNFEQADEGYPALGRGAWAAQSGNPEVATAYLEPLYASKDENLEYYANLATGIAHVKSLDRRDKEAASGEPKAVPKTAADQKDDGSENDSAGADEENSKGAAEGDRQTADAGDTSAGDTDVGRSDTADSPPTSERQSKIETAETKLETAIEISGSIAQPHYWQGRLYEHDGETDKAISAYDTGLGKQNNHVASRLRVAHLQYDKGELKKAIDQVGTILSKLGSAAGDVETAEAYHVRGLIHSARSENRKAIDAFTQAIDKDANRSETLHKLAEAYESAGKYQEALNFFQSNKALEKKNPEVLLGIVRAYMGLERWQDAINKLEEGEKRFPDDARFPYFLGKLHLERGAFSDARSAMERAVSLDSTLLEAYGTLAQLVWRLEKDPSAAEYYVQQIVDQPKLIDATVARKVAGYYRLSDRDELAVKWYKEALKRDPNDWPARLALSQIYLDEERTVEALMLLESAKEAGVKDIRLSAYLADAYRQAERYDRALKSISKVIDKRPENPEYIFIRGLIRFDRGNYDTARRDFNKAYEIDPLYHKAYFYVGRTAFAQGDHKTALKIFRQVLDDKPEKGEYRFWMGRAFEQLSRREDALAEYRKATKHDPEYGEENPKLFVRRGRLLIQLNRPDKGREEIDKALEIDPEFQEAQLAMAEADFSSEDYRTAIENYRKVLNDSPKIPKAQYQLGMALVYEDRKRNGAEHLQKAVRYGYEDPEIYRTLGYLYKELGRNGQAVKAFKSYLRETADEDLAQATQREILNQIKELGG